MNDSRAGGLLCYAGGMDGTGSKWFRHAIAALVVNGLWVSASSAGPFSQLIIFGDSLSDVGNIAAASLDIYPGPYYDDDRFSNGPVFVEALSAGLGLGPTIRSTAGGNNFAYGGAQTSGTGGFQGIFIRDIDEQVDQFLGTRTIPPDALFLVYAGSNDLVNGQSNVNIPIHNLAADIDRLAAAGARNFLVPNLPLLGQVPRFNTSPDTLTQYNALSSQFNTALAALLDDLEATDASLQFFRFDVESLVNEALADPAAFGLTNVTAAAAPGLEPGTSVYDTSRIAPNANQYLFWDDLHPTAAVHAVLAERALALFVLPGDYNQNGAVDVADYVAWRDTLGQLGSGLAADGDGNGAIDSGDYDLWRAHFGRPVAQSAARSAVPEPAPRLLAILAVFLVPLARKSPCIARWRG